MVESVVAKTEETIIPTVYCINIFFLLHSKTMTEEEIKVIPLTI